MAKDKTASKNKAAKIKKPTLKKKQSKTSKSSGMSLYSNLAYKRRVREDARARKKAEELAKLPKNPILRFFARLRPDRVLRAWFSKEGQLFILKCLAALVLIVIIGIGGSIIAKNATYNTETQEFNFQGHLTIGQMSSLLTYGIQILMSLMMVSIIMVMLVMSLEAIRRIGEVLEEEPTIKNCENPIYEMTNGDVDFNNVTFKYSKKAEKNTLENLNIHIKSGQFIGILGSTGSGKTSLINLISRLYDITSGSLTVGDRDVKEYDLETLRNNVAVVLQKNFLFSGTISENLRWGDINASQEEIERACHIAQADEFIEQLPNKYETRIEQGGSNVSGGQRQRLCIARALLKKPKILILDDSTSAVDTKTDRLIRNGLKNDLPETTKIVIAQRISSIEDADQIIIMEDGHIDAIGNHEQLLKSNHIYQEIYYTQNRVGGDQ